MQFTVSPSAKHPERVQCKAEGGKAEGGGGTLAHCRSANTCGSQMDHSLCSDEERRHFSSSIYQSEMYPFINDTLTR